MAIILLPGLGGAREGMLREGAILARHGYGLLVSDLRSCAHPEGQTTLGYLEAQDLIEAVAWVRGQPGRGPRGGAGLLAGRNSLHYGGGPGRANRGGDSRGGLLTWRLTSPTREATTLCGTPLSTGVFYSSSGARQGLMPATSAPSL